MESAVDKVMYAKDRTGRVMMYLIGLIIFLCYKLYVEYQSEYAIVMGLSIFGLVSTFLTGVLMENVILKGQKISSIQKELAKFGLMIIVGGVSMYVLFYKGFYGAYQLTDNFTWPLLAFRLLVIFYGIKFNLTLGDLQDVYKNIR